MRKITTTAELRGALTGVLRYAKSKRPSRYVLAHELAEIATRMDQDAVSALTVVRRFAKVFTSPEAMQEYLKSHPKADPAKHSVKQQDSSKKPRAKKPKSEADSDEIDDESSKGLEALRSKWKDKKKPEPKEEKKPEPPKDEEPKEGTFAHAKKKFNESKAVFEKAKKEEDEAYEELGKAKEKALAKQEGEFSREVWRKNHDAVRELQKKVDKLSETRKKHEDDMYKAHSHGVKLRDAERKKKDEAPAKDKD